MLARAIINELVGLRAARRAEGAGNASVAQDRAQEALIATGYPAALKPIEETCDSAGPDSKPYQVTLSRMAEELGLPSPTS